MTSELTLTDLGRSDSLDRMGSLDMQTLDLSNSPYTDTLQVIDLKVGQLVWHRGRGGEARDSRACVVSSDGAFMQGFAVPDGVGAAYSGVAM
jgi:hypothetical protein